VSCVPNHEQFDTPASGGPADREQILWLPIEQLRLGLYVHPLSRESFVLKQQSDLETLRSSGVKGVFVDLARSEPVRTGGASRLKAGERSPRPGAAALPASKSPADGGLVRAAAFDRAAETLANVRAPVERLLNEARLGRVASNQAISSVVAEITTSVAANASAVISLARMRTKDGFTYAHSIAVCALMANLAQRMGLDAGSQQELAVAGLLHDVGKMMVPNQVLTKPGRLTKDETEIMRSHVLRGHDLLKRTNGLPSVALDVCLHHHEKVDGSGYPHGLDGREISLAAKMGAVCDVYDAITSNRPYKEAWTPSECLADMFSWQGHFDRGVLSAFIKSVGIYPVGSMLRMQSGHLALVLEQHEADLTKPLVRLFYSIAERKRVAFRDLVLGDDCGDAVVGKEDPRAWGFVDWDRQWPRMLKA
jgi:putative nucleotidyltransferase with HDIG domain